MKNTHVCPKCGSRDVVRIPDHPSRYASGSNIYTSKYTLMGKIPVIRYVCCGCGYVDGAGAAPPDLRGPVNQQEPGTELPCPAFAEIHRKPTRTAPSILPVLPRVGR